MKELVQTDTFTERRIKVNQYIMQAGNVRAFSLIYPDADYQGVELTVVGGAFVNSSNGTTPIVGDTTLTLTANSDNFVYVDRTDNSIKTATTAPSGADVYVLYNVTLNEFEEISGIVDYRTWLVI